MPEAADQPGGPELAARFAAAYPGSYPVEDAPRWAQEAVPAPSPELRRRRRELYRQAVDRAAIRRYETDSDAWDAELRLIRTAYSAATRADSAGPAAGSPEPAARSPGARPRRSRRPLLLAIGGVALAAAVAAAGPSASPSGARATA